MSYPSYVDDKPATVHPPPFPEEELHGQAPWTSKTEHPFDDSGICVGALDKEIACHDRSAASGSLF
jgi:hypothetical protein